jgi:hypothetical protein
MSKAVRSHPHNRSIAALVIAAALAGWGASAAAQQSTRSSPSKVLMPELSIDDLERTFWACDYAAPSGLVDMRAAIPCGLANEDLKQRKFGGDFDKLLAWWQQNKAAQHAALDRVYRAGRQR